MYQFQGSWITDEEFHRLSPRNVFHRQLDKKELPCEEHRNRHILFRKHWSLERVPENAKLYISADDYYKLWINGVRVGQGPAPSYPFRYNYNVWDVTAYLQPGENVIAVHTLYQGLINRVWVSGDQRHGLILDLICDGETVVCSDESFLTHPHSGFREIGTVGYKTQFLEEYDSSAPEVGFEAPEFDDGAWEHAKCHEADDHILVEQTSKPLVFETVAAKELRREENRLTVDFGSNYVGYLSLTAKGKKGDCVEIRCGQELTEEGRVRYQLRANCNYEETWLLADGESRLDQFDYKSFRYVELTVPEGCELTELSLVARHYPFTLRGRMRKDYAGDPELRRIWELCVHTQQYGVQEVIQDCMEREKGFYVGDGCYTALTHMLLTGDDSMARKLIDDGFASAFVTDGLVTCLNCSFMQEIAEYPLMLVYLVLWHYRLTGDGDYLAVNYPKVTALLECYRRDYEKDGLLQNLDKWCVVEWPKNYQDDYAVDIKEGKVCEEPHVSINAYYLKAIQSTNAMAEVLGQPPYREVAPLLDSFYTAFYDRDKKLFRDGIYSDHISMVGNTFPFAFGLCPEPECEQRIVDMIRTRGLSTLSLFCTFPALWGFVRSGRGEEVRSLLLDPGAWLRMLSEDATTTFEGWFREAKWNTSLFHLTFSYAAVFMIDTDLKSLFE